MQWALLSQLFGQFHFLYRGCLISLLLLLLLSLLLLLLPFFVGLSELDVNSVDLDQTPQKLNITSVFT